MKDRIRKIMETQHMTQKVFAQFTGISEGSLSGVFNGRTRPTLQMIDAIHEHLPKVSLEWLMYGRGTMYSDEGGSTEASQGVADAEAVELLDAQGGGSGPTLFGDSGSGAMSASGQASRSVEKTVVKYIDKPERKITEIRIFYDDQTWETFEPKR